MKGVIEMVVDEQIIEKLVKRQREDIKDITEIIKIQQLMIENL